MSDFSTDQGASDEQTADQLTFTVGERKYDAEAAVTKITAQDAHIVKLEQEAADSKAQLEAAKIQLASTTSVQEALAQLQNPVTPQESQPGESTNPLSAEQIGEIANKQLQDIMKKQADEQAQANAQANALSTFNETKAKIVEQYGEKTEQVMNDKAASMGVTVDKLISMASDPTTAGLLLESMKVSKVASQSSPSGSLNTSSFNSSTPEAKPGWYKGSSNDIMAELQRRKQNS